VGLDYIYAWEKLYDAVRFMACTKGDIRERLDGAYASFHTLQVHKIPDANLAKKFQEIMDQLTGKGPVRQTLSAMSDDDAERLATEIFDLFHDVKTRYNK
jgi:hypothetical protein